MLTVSVIALTLAVIFGLFFAADNIQTEIISVGDYIMTVIGRSFYLIFVPIFAVVMLLVGVFAKS